MTLVCVAGIGAGILLIASAVLDEPVAATFKGIVGQVPLEERKPTALQTIADVTGAPASTSTPTVQAPTAGTF
jgi:hypothetical protein